MIASTLTAVLVSAMALCAQALPQQPQQGNGAATVLLVLGLENDGDAATTREIPFRNLSERLGPVSTVQLRSSNNLPIPIDQVVCQAFNNSRGTNKVGPTFNSTSFPVVFAKAGQDLIPIWVYCSDAAGVAAFQGRPAAAAPQVRIQINFGNSEGAAQGEFPVNGQITPARGRIATSVARSGFILSGSNGQGYDTVSCEVFSGANGQDRIGVLLGDGKEVKFGDGRSDRPLGSFRCVNSS